MPGRILEGEREGTGADRTNEGKAPKIPCQSGATAPASWSRSVEYMPDQPADRAALYTELRSLGALTTCSLMRATRRNHHRYLRELALRYLGEHQRNHPPVALSLGNERRVRDACQAAPSAGMAGN